MPRLLWDEEARDDLREIVHHIGIVEQRPAAARKLASNIEYECGRYARNPLLGEERNDLAPQLRHFTIPPFVVFYFPINEGIKVVRIVHGARDYPAFFI